MANDIEDPRETPLHPRHSERVVGHDIAMAHFTAAMAAGKPHHAWLLTGPRGTGKATLAYEFARQLLAGKNNNSSARNLIAARSHPDLFVLQRRVGEGKTAKLKTEISVEDARALSAFFSRTAAMADWRVAIIDAADDLNTESANALLKLVEEPPRNCIILLVCNQPGRLLRTMRSRCLRVEVSPLVISDMAAVFAQQRFVDETGLDVSELALELANGSPGRALDLLHSEATKAFQILLTSDIRRPETRLMVVNSFAGRGPSTDDYALFTSLLLAHVAQKAKADRPDSHLASAYSDILQLSRKTDAFNLDRRLAILDSLVMVDRALNAA